MKRTLAILPFVALAMWAMKRYYADASVDELQWILGPTAQLVTTLTGVPFEWESGQGYLSRERFFLIEKACAGINFMIAAFGMVAVLRGRRVGSCRAAAGVVLMSALASYVAAVLVNAARITVALWLAAHPVGFAWMTPAQAHRVEGIACYFGGLVVLHELVQRFERGSEDVSAWTLVRAPLFWYYAMAVAVPLLNGAAGNGAAFVEHTLFVVTVPLVFIALAAGGRTLARVFAPSAGSGAAIPTAGRAAPPDRSATDARARADRPDSSPSRSRSLAHLQSANPVHRGRTGPRASLVPLTHEWPSPP